MATYTSRLTATKPAGDEDVAIAVLNSNFDLFDAAAGTTVAAAASKPASAFSGRMWYETDTGLLKVNTAVSASAAASWVSPGGGSSAFLNVKDYGATGNGSTDDTTAINAARSAGGNLFFPAGNYVYTGSGLNWQGLSLRGEGRDHTIVTLGSGVSFVVGSNVHTKLHIADMRFNNGFGAVRVTGTSPNTGPVGTHTIERCDFHDYTGTAISLLSTDSPNWSFRDCHFHAANQTTSMGIVLPGDVNNSVIDHCAFGNNKVHVKLGPGPGIGATGVTVRRSDFIYGNAYVGSPRTDVWVVPSSSQQGGPTIEDCKFGSENRNGADYAILIADEDTATGSDASTRLPKDGTVSTATAYRLTVNNCRWSNAGTGGSVIYSTTPSLLQTTVRNLSIGGNNPDYIVEFHTTTNVAASIANNQGTIDGLIADSGTTHALSNSTYLPMLIVDDPRHTISPTLTNTATYDPPSLAAGAAANTTVTVTGAEPGDFVLATHTSVQTAATSWVLTGYVSASNTVRVVFFNATGGTVDLGSGTLRVQVFKQ